MHNAAEQKALPNLPWCGRTHIWSGWRTSRRRFRIGPASGCSCCIVPYGVMHTWSGWSARSGSEPMSMHEDRMNRAEDRSGLNFNEMFPGNCDFWLPKCRRNSINSSTFCAYLACSTSSKEILKKNNLEMPLMILESSCWCWFCLSTTWGRKESDDFGFTLWIRTKMMESLRGCTQNLLTWLEMQMIASSSSTGWLLRNLNIFTLCWNLNFTGRRQTFGSLFHLESGWPLHWGKFWFCFNSLFKCLKHIAFKTLRTSLFIRRKCTKNISSDYQTPRTSLFLKWPWNNFFFAVEHLSGLINKHSEHPCISMNPATTSCLPWNISREYLHRT